MRRKGLILLMSVTAVVTAAALLPSRAPETEAAADAGRLVLSAFADDPSAAVAIKISGGGKEATLRREQVEPTSSGDAARFIWVVDDRSGYRADQAKVGAALAGLARLKLSEPKTRRDDLYSRLAVEDPAQSDAKSLLARIYDVRGASLGEVIVGKKRPDRLGGGNDGTYVRRPNNPQAWLAEGAADLTADARDWLDKRIVSLSASRFRQIVTAQADGTTLTLSRAKSGDDLTLPDAPADAKYLKPFKRNDLANFFNGLELTDVASAAGFQAPADPPLKAEWTGFDGLVISAVLMQKDGTPWLELSAAATQEAAKDEARKLDAEWSRWVYAIPPFKANALKINRSDVLEAPNHS